jgi:hypothetical protein
MNIRNFFPQGGNTKPLKTEYKDERTQRFAASVLSDFNNEPFEGFLELPSATIKEAAAVFERFEDQVILMNLFAAGRKLLCEQASLATDTVHLFTLICFMIYFVSEKVLPLSVFESPSHTREPHIANRKDKGKLGAFFGFIAFLDAFYKDIDLDTIDVSYMNCGREAVKLMKTECPDDTLGYLKGWVHETALGSILMGIIAKYQGMRSSCSDFLACREFPNMPDGTYKRVDGCILLKVDGQLYPSGLFRISTTDSVSVEKMQLFAYTNNFDKTLFANVVPYMVGIAVYLDEPHSIAAVGYYKVIDEKGNFKFAVVPLLDNIYWTVKNFAKVGSFLIKRITYNFLFFLFRSCMRWIFLIL